VVHQLVDEVESKIVTHEYAAAFRDYFTALTRLRQQVRRGQELSLDQMDEVDAAKLRLENARTLCELYVARALDLAPQPSPPRHGDRFA
jgi:hypothetical protein